MSYTNSRKLTPAILRAYDIRGIVGELLNVDDAYFIGRGIATKVARKYGLKNPKIAVGRDGRL